MIKPRMVKPSLISIIVPVFNTEKYLTNCIESIIHQSYNNIEIILINDGSTDNSINILKHFKQLDSRIILIEQENKGVSLARNIGIKRATGEFILFVDSDDWIDTETCSKAIQSMIEKQVDLVLFSYLREFENGSSKKRYILKQEKLYDKSESQELRRRLFGLIDEELCDPSHADTLGTVYGKLYKTDIIKTNNIEFIDIHEIGSGEDILFNIHYMKFVSKTHYIHFCFYHLRKLKNSSITSSYRENLFEQWQFLFNRMGSIIRDEQLSNGYYSALNNRIAVSIFGLGFNEITSKKSHIEKVKKIDEIITSTKYKDAYSQLEFTYLPIHWKIFFYFAKIKLATGIYLLLRAMYILINR